MGTNRYAPRSRITLMSCAAISTAGRKAGRMRYVALGLVHDPARSPRQLLGRLVDREASPWSMRS
jgi:hypothetical protein